MMIASTTITKAASETIPSKILAPPPTSIMIQSLQLLEHPHAGLILHTFF